jgi:hypothetical protein
VLYCWGNGKEGSRGNLDSMTKNQRIVMVWLQENCSASSVIRCSNSEVAEVFGWSQPYGKKILSSLVEDGYLEVLQKGTGHRPTKYKVSSFSHNPSHNHGPLGRTNQHVRRDSLQRVGTYSIKKETQKEQGLPVQGMRVHERMQRLFDNAKRVRKPVSASASPFKRFQAKWDCVSTWNATDFVCYYSFLFQARYKEDPVLDWPKECGAARILLDRLRTKEAFKGFLQIAFYIYRGKPKGLNSFSYTDFYENVIDREITPEMMIDFEDDEVFPWLRVPKREKAHAAALEYQQQLWDRRGNVQQYMAKNSKQARLNRIDRVMKENWHLYSEIAH